MNKGHQGAWTPLDGARGAVPLGAEVFCIAHRGGDNLLLQMSAEILHGTQGEANLSLKVVTEMGQKAPRLLPLFASLQYRGWG